MKILGMIDFLRKLKDYIPKLKDFRPKLIDFKACTEYCHKKAAYPTGKQHFRRIISSIPSIPTKKRAFSDFERICT